MGLKMNKFPITSQTQGFSLNSQENTKYWYQSKTFWAGALGLAVGVSGLLFEFYGKPFVNTSAATAWLVNGLAMVALRFVTNSPVKFK